ncbi:hypothetical protein EXIGLDRAFT_830011 [Exidia glandulosa HHB12029]|uniref:G domain-containing protein n=1 Tax=Exidia glandulosa HHB12029 TaxID=1314781 RepID=A0A165P260_EXIGL|nr:hypothetical protein EXIGLDRAFT_830011 [Exidia glandulosa HHB12029]
MHQSSADKPILIACIGRTGSGKSSFIRAITDKYPAENETTYLASRIEEISVVLENDRQVTFIDTPGFDDANANDIGTLRLLANHLELAHKNKHKLSGILFFHRITTPSRHTQHLEPVSNKTLRMFASLCGHASPRNVLLCTTMWDRVSSSPERGEKKEAELLARFWRPMVERGSTVRRHDNTTERAVDIVNSLIEIQVPTTLRQRPGSALAERVTVRPTALSRATSPLPRVRHESMTPTLVDPSARTRHDSLGILKGFKERHVHWSKDQSDLRKELVSLLDGLCGEIRQLKHAREEQQQALAERDAEIAQLRRSQSPAVDSDQETLRPAPSPERPKSRLCTVS